MVVLDAVLGSGLKLERGLLASQYLTSLFTLD